MIIRHPAELTLYDMHCMDRDNLVEQLLSFNDYYPFHFERQSLAALQPPQLRNLLYIARRQYHEHGY